MASRSVSTVTLNPTVDVAIVVDELLVNHKMLASSERRDPGGGGVNVARSLCRLDIDARAVITSGGPTGAELRALLAGEGVRTVPVPIAGLTRESVSLRDDSTGDQYRVVMPGPALDDVPDVVATTSAAVQGRDIVVLSGRLNPGLPADTYRHIAEHLSDAIVVVDTPQPWLAGTLDGWCSLVKPSRRELLSVVGLPAEADVDVVEVAREVLGRGSVEALLVSLGPDGAALVAAEGPVHFYRPPEIDRVVSTVGCGDAMVAGVVAGLARGLALADAVMLGVATGTAAALTPGTELFDPAIALDLEASVVRTTID